MAKDKFPNTDKSKCLHEDHKFKNTGSLDDMILRDNDHITWPAHLTTPVGKTLVITGRDAARTFDLREQLFRFYSFMDTTLSRRRDLACLVILSISPDEVLADSHLRAEDNNIYKRIPNHPDPDFMLTLIGRLQKIQTVKGGKAIVVFPQHPIFQPNWHPDDATDRRIP